LDVNVASRAGWRYGLAEQVYQKTNHIVYSVFCEPGGGRRIAAVCSGRRLFDSKNSAGAPPDIWLLMYLPPGSGRIIVTRSFSFEEWWSYGGEFSLPEACWSSNVKVIGGGRIVANLDRPESLAFGNGEEIPLYDGSSEIR